MAQAKSAAEGEISESSAFASRIAGRMGATVVILLLVLSLVSHHADDAQTLSGGLGDTALIHNWIGRFGAYLSGTLIAWLGLGVYPVMLLVIVCLIRRVAGTVYRKFNILYFIGVLTFAIGVGMILGVFPDMLPALQVKLNLLNTPGGAVGQRFCAPGSATVAAGWLSYVVNPTGCIIITSAMMLLGLATLWFFDWQQATALWITGMRTNWQAQREAAIAAREQAALDAAEDAAERERERRDAILRGETEPQAAAAPAATAADNRPTTGVVRPASTRPVATSSLKAPTAVPAPAPQPAAAPVAQPAPVPAAPAPASAFAPLPASQRLPESKGEMVVPPPGGGNRAASPAPAAAARKPAHAYVLPGIELLNEASGKTTMIDAKEVQAKKEALQETLESFGIDAQVGEATCGPRVTLFEVKPAPGVKVERITALANNIAMNLRAESLRIQAPIPGKDTVGIEVPNSASAMVSFREILESKAWRESRGGLPIGLGKNIKGEHAVLDLSRCPHLLIAGATGAGKSVCMNTLILSLLFRFTPQELKLIMVDPKVVEFSGYNEMPHLVTPVLTDVKKVPVALNWAVRQMEWRYRVLAKVGVRNIQSFNTRTIPAEPVMDDDGNPIPEKLPYIVIIIDELADLMMTARGDVETSLARIAQLARAVGIHSVIATQRPSVDVLTGLIKANFPTRIAFQVSSLTDSRTILDGKGAESLLGRGDMLFKPPGGARLERTQGAMVADEEIDRVVQWVKSQAAPQYIDDIFAGAGADKDEEDGTGFGARSGKKNTNAGNGGNSNANPNNSYTGGGGGYTGGGDGGGNAGGGRGNSRQSAGGRAGNTSSGNDSMISGDGDSDEDLLQKAIKVIVQDHRATTSHIQRRLRIGYNRAALIIEELERRGIIGPQIGTAPRDILITAEGLPGAPAAGNAADGDNDENGDDPLSS